MSMQALYVYSKSRLSTVDVMLLLIGARDLSSLLTIAGSFSLANAIEQSTVDGAGRSGYSCHPESRFWWCISTPSTHHTAPKSTALHRRPGLLESNCRKSISSGPLYLQPLYACRKVSCACAAWIAHHKPCNGQLLGPGMSSCNTRVEEATVALPACPCANPFDCTHYFDFGSTIIHGWHLQLCFPTSEEGKEGGREDPM